MANAAEMPGTLVWGGASYVTESMIVPCTEPAADGFMWHGLAMNMGGSLYYTVWKERDGVFTQVWKSHAGDHRGVMRAHANGQLRVTLIRQSGDGQPIGYATIGGYVPFANQGPVGPTGPQGEPGSIDPRVDQLAATTEQQATQIASLMDEVAQMQTALANATGGGLDAEHAAALAWVVDLRRLL